MKEKSQPGNGAEPRFKAGFGYKPALDPGALLNLNDALGSDANGSATECNDAFDPSHK